MNNKTEFKKFDTGKPMMTLLNPNFIESMAQVLTMGAKKYDKHNWKTCDDVSRFEDAMYRHLNTYLKGNKIDDESGITHLAHIAVNAMFLYYFDKNEHKII